MSIWNSAVHSVHFCANSLHLVQGRRWFGIINLSPSPSLFWGLGDLQTDSYKDLHLLPLSSDAGIFEFASRGWCQGSEFHVSGWEEVWVETGLLQEHWKGQFCHPLCCLGRIDHGVNFAVQAPSSHVHAVSCIRKPWYQMRPLGDALWVTNSNTQKGRKVPGGRPHVQQRCSNHGLLMRR